MRTVTIKDVEIGDGRPKVCVPIIGKNPEEIMQAARHLLTEPCDLVEWRADFFEDVMDTEKVKNVAEQLQQVIGNKPLLFTFRTIKEGGEREIEEDSYIALNQALILSGKIDLIDLEFFMPKPAINSLIALAQQYKVKTILCNHDFEKTPSREEIIYRLRGMQDRGADICKIAVMPQRESDVLTLLAATNEMHKKFADRPIITMSMGHMGVVSRLAGEVFGSAVSFGTVGRASAPGQIPANKLIEILDYLHLP